MPFIEDNNGLAIYFTREEWEVILDEVAESLEIQIANDANTPYTAMLVDIVSKIRKHVP
jgi:hypothetical protein